MAATQGGHAKVNKVCVANGPSLATLAVETRALPEPSAGEALIRIEAAGVAYTDLMIISGTYFRKFKHPLIPGYDWVGRVERLGAGTNNGGIAVGDRVAALSQVGGMQQYVCWPVDDLVKVPEGCDPAEAVCCVLNYTTAYGLLHRAAAGHIKPGCSILVHSAAGGAGTALLHLAQLAGVTHIYGTCSAGKMAQVAREGATPIDYRHEDFVQRIDELTGGRGVDVVFDAIGGAHVQRSYKCLNSTGKLVCYGFTGAESAGKGSSWDKFVTVASVAAYHTRFWTRRSASFFGVAMLKDKHPHEFRADLAKVLGLLAEGKLHPLVFARVPLQDAPSALGLVSRMAHVGKIVVICDDRLVREEESRGRLMSAAALSQHPPDIRVPAD